MIDIYLILSYTGLLGGLFLAMISMATPTGGWQLRLGVLLIVIGYWASYGDNHNILLLLALLIIVPIAIATVVWLIVAPTMVAIWRSASKGTEDEGKPVPGGATSLAVVMCFVLGLPEMKVKQKNKQRKETENKNVG